MKRKLCSMFVAMLATSLLCTIVMAEIDTADHTYSGKLDFTPSADIRIRNGVRLTATSDELNIMDGVTATAEEISMTDISASSNNATAGLMYTLKGGASFSATSPLYTNQSLSITVPDNAIVMAGVIDVSTALISTSNDGTLDIHLRGGASILDTIDADTIAATHTNRTECLFSVPGTWIKTTSNTVVEYTTATHVVTNGVFNITLFYIMGQ